MVGIGTFRQPGAPEVVGALQVRLRLLDRARPPRDPPSRRSRRSTSRLPPSCGGHARGCPRHPCACPRTGGTPSVPSTASSACWASSSDRLPPRHRRPVVEHRLADHLDLHLPLDALDHAHQQVIGVVVGRRARVAGALLVVVPLTDRQRIDHANPALRRHPRRLDHVRARQVAPAGRHVDPVGPDPEAPGPAIEHRREHARGVEVRQTQPLHRAVGGDQRPGVAVGQEAVVRDRRKGRVLH